MRKIITLLAVLVMTQLAMPTADAITKPQESKKVESLKYNAYWHWGFIWKLAGSGTLDLFEETIDGNKRYRGLLCGRSLSIVETIMKVRDTLECYYTADELIPLEYSKKTHEGSYEAVERNYYHTYAGGQLHRNVYEVKRSEVDSTQIDIFRWRIKKGNDRVHVSNPGAGFDMLSIFYELRNMDFEKMKAGQKIDYHITAGVKNKVLHATFKGKGTCTLKNGRKYQAYNVELTFASKDSDSTPVQAWLATTPDHRPLSVVIQLKRIGSVQGEIVE